MCFRPTEWMCTPWLGTENVKGLLRDGRGVLWDEARYGLGPLQGLCAGVFTLVLGHVVGGSERVPPSTFHLPGTQLGT